MTFEKTIVISTIIGVMAFIVIMALMFMSGSTFGQRCSSMGYVGNKYSECVNTLSQGKEY